MKQYLLLAGLGFCGALVNAGTRLITLVLGESVPTRRQIQKAWAQFVVACFFGPVASVAFTPVVLPIFGARNGMATAVAIGLSANALWPIFVDGIVPMFRKTLSGWLTDMGSSLKKGGTSE